MHIVTLHTIDVKKKHIHSTVDVRRNLITLYTIAVIAKIVTQNTIDISVNTVILLSIDVIVNIASLYIIYVIVNIITPNTMSVIVNIVIIIQYML